MKTRKLLSMLIIVALLLQCFVPQNHIGYITTKAAEDVVEEVQDAKQGDKVVFKGNTFKVTYEITSKWNTAYNASVTLENTGKNTIHDWALIFYSNDNITNLWNGTVANSEEGLYLVDNATWNMDIKAGQSVNFGYTAEYENNVVIPPSYALSSCRAVVAEEDYKVDYTLYSDSGDMINSAMSIENLTDEVIEDWGLEFDFDAEINNIWKAKILNDDACNEEGHFVLRNPGDEQNVELDRNVEFGFLGKTENSKNVPHNFKLTKYSNEIDYTLDSDSDGLTNVQEVVMGCNAYLTDTDEDGLDDYLEACYLYLSPCDKDTDNNGIEDGDEDTDEDGLTNVQELKYNCKGWISDTDEEGLLDGEEIHKYDTDPTKEDTDEDALNDYDEVQIGLNPLKKDSDGNGILDSEEKFQQSVTLNVVETEKVEIEAVTVSSKITGNMQSNTTIENVYGEDMVCSEAAGLVGVPVDITSSGNFDEATIRFHYDEEKLEHSEENLMIMWFDEENDTFVPMESTQVDTEKNEIRCTTTHFSKYFVVYYNEWINIWKNAPDYRNATTYHDVLLSIDVSGSMKDTKLAKAKKGAKTLANYMYKNDRMALMTYDNAAKLRQKFTCDPDVLKKEINAITTGGATDSNVGLKQSVNTFTKKSYVSTGNKKHVIILSDGALKYKKKVINKAKANDIVIHMVLMSDDADRIKKCKKIARKTGGKYYHVTSDADIATKMKKLSKYIFGKANTKDSDGDGLYDVYEEMGMMTIGGQLIQTNPNKSDSDSDGLTDGYEMTGKKTIKGNPVKKQIILYGGKTMSVYRFQMRSNPKKVDSDGDFDKDKVDPKPLTKELNGYFIKKVKQLRNVAKEYLNTHGGKLNADQLVCVYIRGQWEDYREAQWDCVTGTYDDEFELFLKKTHFKLFTYFLPEKKADGSQKERMIYANGSEKMVDVYHLFATLGGQIFNSKKSDWNNKKVALLYHLAPEGIIDNLAGWAGDLQSLMAFIYDNHADAWTYGRFSKKMSSYLFLEDAKKTPFSKSDLYADIDANNIAAEYNEEKNIVKALNEYYKKGYKKRYTTFCSGYGGTNRFYSQVANFTSAYYQNAIPWPLFMDKPLKYRYFFDPQCRAACDTFYKYIVTQTQKE